MCDWDGKEVLKKITKRRGHSSQGLARDQAKLNERKGPLRTKIKY